MNSRRRNTNPRRSLNPNTYNAPRLIKPHKRRITKWSTTALPAINTYDNIKFALPTINTYDGIKFSPVGKSGITKSMYPRDPFASSRIFLLPKSTKVKKKPREKYQKTNAQVDAIRKYEIQSHIPQQKKHRESNCTDKDTSGASPVPVAVAHVETPQVSKQPIELKTRVWGNREGRRIGPLRDISGDAPMSAEERKRLGIPPPREEPEMSLEEMSDAIYASMREMDELRTRRGVPTWDEWYKYGKPKR